MVVPRPTLLIVVILTFCFSTSSLFSQNPFDDGYVKVDSTANDISYQKYYSTNDKIPGMVITDTNGTEIGYEPTFAERFFRNLIVDNSDKVRISKAVTAREIVKCLVKDKYGVEIFSKIENYGITLVDDKVWCIVVKSDKNSLGGINVVLISKYDGKILRWDIMK
jgi:endoglucanase Acf2